MIDIHNDNQKFKIEERTRKNIAGIKHSKLYKEKYQKMFGFTNENSSTDFLFNEAKKYDVYKIWRKVLEQELNPKELFLFLYFKLGLRGVFFKSFEFDKSKQYTLNDSLFKTIYEDVYYKRNRKYRDASNGDLTYSIYHNWKDIETVLLKCSYIDQEFIEDYKNIFFRHSDFSKGPGNFKLNELQSKWGIKWDSKKTEEEMLNVNLWDSKISDCPISLAKNKKDKRNQIQKRLNQYFFIPELVNIISQLVYVRIGTSTNDANRLTKEQILEIINNSLKEQKTITKTRIEKFFKDQLQTVSLFNFPTTKDEESSNFESMNKLIGYFKDKLIEFDNKETINIETIYQVIQHVDEKRFKLVTNFFERDDSKNDFKTQNKNYQKTIEELNEILKEVKCDGYKFNVNNLANFKEIKEIDFTGTRKYGLNAVM